MINVAMVEDDIELADILTQYLKQFNIEVTNFEEPFLALSTIALKKYDLIILDLTLPGLDGLEVCEKILQQHNIPIIISSARSDITDKVAALQMGADDYLPKPYDPRELEIRIRTILRRYNNSTEKTDTLKTKKTFEFNNEKRVILKNDKEIKLTNAEFDILSLLISREGFVITREDIFEECETLSNDTQGSSSLAVIVNRIRQKIEDNPKTPSYLQTIRGMGYKFVQNSK